MQDSTVVSLKLFLWLMGTGGGIIGVLLGILYKVNQNQIKRVELGLNTKMSIRECALERTNIGTRFESIGRSLDNFTSSNTNDHSTLEEMVKEFKIEQKIMSKSLVSMDKCLALLSEKIPCQ